MLVEKEEKWSDGVDLMKLVVKSIVVDEMNGFINRKWKRRMNRNHVINSLFYYCIVFYRRYRRRKMN